jgi:hypothetical protein
VGICAADARERVSPSSSTRDAGAVDRTRLRFGLRVVVVVLQVPGVANEQCERFMEG